MLAETESALTGPVTVDEQVVFNSPPHTITGTKPSSHTNGAERERSAMDTSMT